MHRVGRGFVIEAEAVRRVADPTQPARTRNEPRFLPRPQRFAPTWHHDRVQRIGRKGVHHICHQQLLVLLFVVQTKLHDGQRLVGQSCDCVG